MFELKPQCNMNTGTYVFIQLIKLLPKEAFDWIVKNYEGDKYVKHFTCWNQLLVMMFGQLYGCDRLRELVSVVTAHSRKAYHLGFGKEEIKLANLAKTNANRDYHIFDEYSGAYWASILADSGPSFWRIPGQNY